MNNQIQAMSFKELQSIVAALASDARITPETKVFLDTGWDSLQEILPGSIKVATAKTFSVPDPLTNERYPGYALAEKAEKFEADEAEETVIVIENLY
ncbi:hypothetical protein [Enterococcus asini]|uniref:hypothetical protein n=1 Tax=Enterococcus asini TaxID=57732 RepID=UPI0026DC4F82|nr:hypothetical protein [Enterococcus asini]